MADSVVNFFFNSTLPCRGSHFQSKTPHCFSLMVTMSFWGASAAGLVFLPGAASPFRVYLVFAEIGRFSGAGVSVPNCFVLSALSSVSLWFLVFLLTRFPWPFFFFSCLAGHLDLWSYRGYTLLLVFTLLFLILKILRILHGLVIHPSARFYNERLMHLFMYLFTHSCIKILHIYLFIHSYFGNTLLFWSLFDNSNIWSSYASVSVVHCLC